MMSLYFSSSVAKPLYSQNSFSNRLKGEDNRGNITNLVSFSFKWQNGSLFAVLPVPKAWKSARTLLLLTGLYYYASSIDLLLITNAVIISLNIIWRGWMFDWHVLNEKQFASCVLFKCSRELLNIHYRYYKALIGTTPQILKILRIIYHLPLN